MRYLMALKEVCSKFANPNPITALAGKTVSHLTQINIACFQG